MSLRRSPSSLGSRLMAAVTQSAMVQLLGVRLDNLPGEVPQSSVTDLETDLTAINSEVAAKAATADLASTDLDKGAALVGLTKGNVRHALRFFTPEMFVEEGESVGTGAADSQPVLQRAIDYVASLGGGDLVIPNASYVLGKPLTLKNGVAIVGLGKGFSAAGVFKGPVFSKTNASVTDDEGVDCVVQGVGVRDFIFKNVMLSGNRTSASDNATILAGNAVITASSFGLYMKGCNNFTLENVRASNHQIGFRFHSCYIGTINTCGATLCEGYGWYLNNACTSLTFNGSGSYATGGHLRMESCVYITWNSPYSDLIDRGRLPFGSGADLTKDPFAATGTFKSGGDYANPAFVWNLSGCKGIVINGAGQEAGYSRWLYAEGTHVTFNSPYSTLWTAASATWRWVQMRGTGRSVVVINAPFGFNDTVKGTAAAQGAVFIENPAVQRLFINGQLRLTNFTSTTDYSTQGIVHADQQKLVDLTQATMPVGGVPQILKPAAGDTATFQYTSGKKRLYLEATASGSSRFSIPLGVSKGFFLLRANGTASGLGDVISRFRLAEYTAAGVYVGDIHTFLPTVGATWSVAEWKFAEVVTPANNLRLDIPMLSATEDLYLENFELIYVPNQ